MLTFPLIILDAGENERFVGIAESLGEHHHHYGDLDVRAVDSHHRTRCLFRTAEEIGNHHLTHVLTHHSRNAEYQQRPAVGEHAPQQRPIESRFPSFKFRNETHQHDKSGNDVGREYPSDAERLSSGREIKPFDQPGGALHQSRASKQEEEVERYVHSDVEQFYAGETIGFLAIAQIGKG